MKRLLVRLSLLSLLSAVGIFAIIQARAFDEVLGSESRLRISEWELPRSLARGGRAGRGIAAGAVRLECDHLRARRVARGNPFLEVELQLALALGRQRAEYQLERCAALQLRCDLFDRLQIREGVLPHLTRHVRLVAEQAPLLEIPQVVLGDTGIQASNLPMAERTTRR